MNGVRYGEPGFSLVETLIAILLAAVLLGLMFSSYSSQYRRFRLQEQTAEAQQNSRAAIQLMSRDLIMAGYSTSTGIIFANRTSLTIRSFASNISYSRYSSSSIGRSSGGTRQAVAERVRTLSFKYKDSSGNLLTPDASGNVPVGSITQILISVTSGTPVFSGYSASCTLETILTPRNL